MVRTIFKDDKTIKDDLTTKSDEMIKITKERINKNIKNLDVVKNQDLNNLYKSFCKTFLENMGNNN
jgi:hypothetical protein